MKNLKKVLLTGTLTVVALLTISTYTNAATVKITGEVVNIRKEARGKEGNGEGEGHICIK